MPAPRPSPLPSASFPSASCGYERSLSIDAEQFLRLRTMPPKTRSRAKNERTVSERCQAFECSAEHALR
jgi:hypothetical protein